MLNGRTVVFLSCHGADLEPLARPIRDDLNDRGHRPVIVGDEPLLRGTFDPESKVTAYVNASDAAVALCTRDERVPGGTAQNIIDEIGQARTHPKLRDVVCVLKEPGVTLTSNINPTWEDLRQDDPAAALATIVRQLEAWDVRPEVPGPLAPEPAGPVASHRSATWWSTGASSCSGNEPSGRRSRRQLPSRTDLPGVARGMETPDAQRTIHTAQELLRLAPCNHLAAREHAVRNPGRAEHDDPSAPLGQAAFSSRHPCRSLRAAHHKRGIQTQFRAPE
jgi:hypothetical protein